MLIILSAALFIFWLTIVGIVFIAIIIIPLLILTTGTLEIGSIVATAGATVSVIAGATASATAGATAGSVVGDTTKKINYKNLSLMNPLRGPLKLESLGKTFLNNFLNLNNALTADGELDIEKTDLLKQQLINRINSCRIFKFHMKFLEKFLPPPKENIWWDQILPSQKKMLENYNWDLIRILFPKQNYELDNYQKLVSNNFKVFNFTNFHEICKIKNFDNYILETKICKQNNKTSCN